MPFSVSASLEGVAKAMQQLQDCSKRIRKSGTRGAVNEATRILTKEAKSRAPKWARRTGRMSAASSYAGGMLKKSLGRKVKVYPSGVVVGIVGARKGFREAVAVRTRDGSKNAKGSPVYIDPVKYLHLVELGSARAAGRHFLRESFQAVNAQIADAMVAKVKEALAKEGGGS